MLTIIYDPHKGVATPDGKAEQVVADLISRSKTEDVEHITSSALVVDHLRLCVGPKISPEDVRLQFDGRTIEVSATGRIAHWPEGFCDYQAKVLQRLARNQVRI